MRLLLLIVLLFIGISSAQVDKEPPKVIGKEQAQSDQGKPVSGGQNDGAQNLPAAIPGAESKPQKKPEDGNTPKQEERSETELWSFRATCLSALIAVLMLVITGMQYSMARMQAILMKGHERAYIFPIPRPVPTADKRSTALPMRLFVHNAGRTVGIVKSVFWKTIKRADLPFIPQYGPMEPVNHPISGAIELVTKATPLSYSRNWSPDEWVVYGQIEYEDIFKKTHRTGFLSSIRVQYGEDPQHFTVDKVSDQYTDWD